MYTEEFNFDLPETLIAHSPAKNREDSKLMVLDRKSQSIEHCRFSDISHFLPKNSALVLNNTKVFNARLRAKKESGASIELFLLEEVSPSVWKCLAKPAKRLQSGTLLHIADNFSAKVIEKGEFIILEFSFSGSFYDLLELHGEPPLPPYIDASDPKQFADRYQTVFAKHVGSVAAPTAGLHFTPEILSSLSSQGMDINYITLHVGYGTFNPVKADLVKDHRMHSEQFNISMETSDHLSSHKKRGGLIGAVGTTSARTLESAWDGNGFISGQHSSDIFIYPGYRFKTLDFMVTNLHLPKSSLLMLVSAFAGTSFIKKAYAEAIEHKYRFYSFGDAMLIL
ncbi:tRNA preQ1(34) S-adenosylmethionine ribosyltransferase-isomerase QueA [Candidatus Marinamargulisbacteria bacterium SCGC AG-343-D04]|nr:tRNA preQ1(34) S-adenosylmethionine ribosyltransferase-isomerase QueA [Candidatus Marinamargulisbacteria bacterium SCGC AG-343-D04]